MTNKTNNAENKKRKEKVKEVSEKKLKAVDEIARLINESNTFMIASIKNLPASQFQEIRKKLRDNIVIIVAKKSIAEKAIDKIEKGAIKNIKKSVERDFALLFSKLNPFELAALLSENKNPVKAKVGQVADEDISVDAGPTDLVPGPAISELGALGLKIAIEDGKINIREKKVIVKKGEKINEAAANIMAKLDIMPFTIGFEPVAAYEAETENIYIGIKIDKKKALEEIKIAYAKAFGFAQAIVYVCKETIGFLLAKAQSHEKALERFMKQEQTIEKEKKEDIQNIENKSQEEK